MRADLIQILADHMRGVEAKKFSMKSWCGSTMCMGGEACRLLAFNNEGFEFRQYEYSKDQGPYHTPSEKYGFEALAEVLEISSDEAESLFGIDDPVPWWKSVPPRDGWTPKIAAEVLEGFLRWKLTGAVQP